VAAISWQVATVTQIRPETANVKTYSIASAVMPDGSIEITVERVPDGEVSPFMHDAVVVGDRLELRGPIGGYFVWDGSMPDPLLLIAGGSGIVPLMAMLRQRATIGSMAPTTLVYSSRTFDDVIYRDELNALAARSDGLRLVETLTRSQPPDWTGLARRIDREMLASALDGQTAQPQAFICGPTPLVEAAAENLVGLGMSPSRVRTERFGPSGA
jgi:ferredoxin-NADP reductase